MPSIILSGLAAATPDGTPLFSNLDLAFGTGRTGLVGRNGVGKSTLLRLLAGDEPPRAGRLAVDGRIGMLRQTLPQGQGTTLADLFGVRAALDLLDTAAAGLATADELADADWTLDARMSAALDRVGLSVPRDVSLDALSGGQRTRAAIAALLFAAPDILLLDEPTNDLDRDGRSAVIDLLASWPSVALVVSHDRELLETVDEIVELTTLGATRYGGNWSAYRAQKDVELAAVRHDLATAETRLSGEARKAQQTAERKARSDAAGRRKRARNDLPRILLNARADRAGRTTGTNARVAESRIAEATSAADAARERIEVLTPITAGIGASGLAAGRVVATWDGLAIGYDIEHPIRRDLSDRIAGPERIGVVGRNGSGKSTLIRTLAGEVAALAGSAEIHVPFAMLDQRIGLLGAAGTLLDCYRALNPDASGNTARAALARFGFRNDDGLQDVATLSGGERLRAGLAVTLGAPVPPQLLVLDEPTNHLDLDAIAALEAGLRAYDGAILVVSHDETFLSSIELTRRIDLDPERSLT